VRVKSFADGKEAIAHHVILSVEFIHVLVLRIENIPSPGECYDDQDNANGI
jgi:hypothetical protein